MVGLFFLFFFYYSALCFFYYSSFFFLNFYYFFFCRLFFISDIFDSRKFNLSWSFKYSVLAFSNPIYFSFYYSSPTVLNLPSWFDPTLLFFTSDLSFRKYLWLLFLYSSELFVECGIFPVFYIPDVGKFANLTYSGCCDFTLFA